MFSAVANAPAKIMKEFRKGNDKPNLKSAYVQEEVYIGHNQLEVLASIKSKNEMIGEIIGLLQSPTKTIIGGLLAERKGKTAEATATPEAAPTPPKETNEPEAPITPEA